MPAQNGFVTFRASYDTHTKTVLTGLTPYWTPSEKISIFNGVNNQFTANITAPGATAEFVGKLEGKGTKNFRAVTPYSPDYTFSSLGSTFYGLSVPYEQSCIEHTYDSTALVAIAVSDDYKLSFKTLGSLVKFTVISEGVTSVTLRSNSEELMSGNFEATYSATPTIRVKDGKDEVVLHGDFKKDSTYYLVTLPGTHPNGIIAILNNSVKSFAADYPVSLDRNGLVNLGSLSLDPSQSQLPDNNEGVEDEGVPSGWIIIGSFCEWADEGALDTYDLGSYYKAFDVPAASLASFKFKNGDTWVGISGEKVATDKWVAVSSDGGAADISFSGNAGALYDVYLDKDLRGFYITLAGSPSPAPIPEPFKGMTVAGNFNSWDSSANPMEVIGEYYVAKNLLLGSQNLVDSSSNGFKFVDAQESGQTWYGVTSGSIQIGRWYNTVAGDGAVNIKISGDYNALYDVYLSKDKSTFCVVPAGDSIPSTESPDPTPDPNPDPTPDPTPDPVVKECKLMIRVNKSISWYDKYIYSWTGSSTELTGSWPGTKTSWHGEDGNYYVNYYVYDASYNGKTINYIINCGNGGNGNQTNDLSVTLNGAETVVTIEASDVK